MSLKLEDKFGGIERNQVMMRVDYDYFKMKNIFDLLYVIGDNSQQLRQ